MMLPALNGADEVRLMLSIDTFFFLHLQILLGMTILPVILIYQYNCQDFHIFINGYEALLVLHRSIRTLISMTGMVEEV